MMVIKSVLIANRGEIAIRIIKTARRMGIKTYAIQTIQEANAIYLSWADEIITDSTETGQKSVFLNPKSLVDYAKKYKIDALHPGYGFLSENPELSEMCEEAGIVFIGPSAKLIRQMGDKNEARKLAVKAGVPVVPGTEKPVNTLEEAIEEIKLIGYPVILKALAGGGGKGMRVVTCPDQLETMYKLATDEAENAFNNRSMLIERYLEHTRHIEIQILADKQGNAVHLFERECSVQRNHQKLMEEAPSPALTEELRESITNDALSLTRLTKYYTVGTVEFLLNEDGKYYFMEMNTRIQVEHPVTEAITGIDLIEWQIKTAGGESLPFAQSEIKKNGWAMEFRVNAEDVQSSFVPVPGIIDELNFPMYPGLRVDSGFTPGSVIPGIYDSLVAKLIISAKNRPDVIKRAVKIMQHTYIKGIKTTIPFFKELLCNKSFVSGNYSTSILTEMENTFFQQENEEEAAALIALQSFLDRFEKIENDKINPRHATLWISRMWSKFS